MLSAFFMYFMYFYVFLSITNDSIKYRSYVFTQLNDQTVLFQTIPLSIDTQLKCQTVLFDS